MQFRIYRTHTFEKEFNKLSKKEQEEIMGFEHKLVENPYLGKPLGYIFFREKRIDGKRIYYLIYDEIIIVLMVAISTKKTQQATIDAINDKLDEYRQHVKDLIKNL